VCAALSACSLVVGTNKYIVGENESGEDVTVNEAGGDDGGYDAPVADVAPDTKPCTPAGCLADAGVCGSACGVIAANCLAGCSNTPCKNNCNTANTACRSTCATTCNQCAVNQGCTGDVGCADAAAM
jgi:hypothetical protein